MKAVAALALAACATAVMAQGVRGDAGRGERAFLKCYSCHSVMSGEIGLEGPNLRGVIGRRIASQPGFAYSPALRRLAARAERWTPGLLDRFMADPEAVAPHTAMNFVGIGDPRERADILAYLRSAAR